MDKRDKRRKCRIKIKDIKDLLGIQIISGEKGINREVKGAYCGDLLSDVIANAPVGCVWITIQTHQNIVAVAVLREMAGIIIADNHEPDNEAKNNADKESIPILTSSMTSFEIAGRLYEFGIGKDIGYLRQI